MKLYCVKERQFTDNVPGSEEYVKTKNNRTMLKAICASCGITKSSFVKNTEGKGLDIHNAILKVAPKKGFVMPGHHYTGPGNPLESQLKYDPTTGKILEIYQQPSGRTDAVSMQHDVDYSVCSNKIGKEEQVKCKNQADRKMVKSLDSIPYSQRQWGHAMARNAIATKAKLGMGVKKKLARKIS